MTHLLTLLVMIVIDCLFGIVQENSLWFVEKLLMFVLGVFGFVGGGIPRCGEPEYVQRATRDHVRVL